MIVQEQVRHEFHNKTALDFTSGGAGDFKVSLSLDEIERDIVRGKEGIRRRFEDFKRFWESEGSSLLDMQVYFTAVEPAAVESSITRILEEDQGVDLVAADTIESFVYTFWTIGDALERKVNELFDEHEALDAIFLDVAGTRVLLHLHASIQNWLRDNFAHSNHKNIVQEIYPGHDAFKPDELEKIVRAAGADRVIAVTGDGSMCVPKKTMYSFFVLGEGPERLVEEMHACPDCSGTSCLYYQMGGCHLPSGE